MVVRKMEATRTITSPNVKDACVVDEAMQRSAVPILRKTPDRLQGGDIQKHDFSLRLLIAMLPCIVFQDQFELLSALVISASQNHCSQAAE